jgi:hypothetical protein
MNTGQQADACGAHENRDGEGKGEESDPPAAFGQAMSAGERLRSRKLRTHGAATGFIPTGHGPHPTGLCGSEPETQFLSKEAATCL